MEQELEALRRQVAALMGQVEVLQRQVSSIDARTWPMISIGAPVVGPVTPAPQWPNWLPGTIICDAGQPARPCYPSSPMGSFTRVVDPVSGRDLGSAE